jgi:uncharacterized protein (TIGR02145 family)
MNSNIKILFIFAILFMQKSIFAQDTMYVWIKSGSVVKYSVAQIDSIVFKEPEALTDIDGNIYQVVNIGTQKWMAENLKVTRYRNGDLIGTTAPATLDISSESSPKYQWAYNGNETNVATYGRLYTWYTIADNRKVCPSGWHVPSDTEWETLINFLADPGHEGAKLKEAGISHWESPNSGASNSTGYTALPGGSRTSDGVFDNNGFYANFWSSESYNATSAGSKNLSYATESVDSFGTNKDSGLAVRCIKD